MPKRDARPTPPAPPGDLDLDLAAAIRTADADHGLFADGEGIVLGVSGGPDSVALLDAMARFAPERNLRLTVASVDHGLRPAASEEVAFVAGLAAARGLPAITGQRDVPRVAEELGRGIEETARIVRYAFLAAAAAEVGARAVAVAHHADDQAETVLVNLLRGAGLDGLKGMLPVADYPVPAELIARLEGPHRQTSPIVLDTAESGNVERPLRLVRPLLGVTRFTIERYLAEHHLPSREDETNADPRFLRNRLRSQILPLLETVNPRLREALVQLAASAKGDLDYLDSVMDALWSEVMAVETDPAPDSDSIPGQHRMTFDRAQWLALHPALQRRLLRRAVVALGGSTRQWGWLHIERARAWITEGRPAKMLVLPDGIVLRVASGRVILAVEARTNQTD